MLPHNAQEGKGVKFRTGIDLEEGSYPAASISLKRSSLRAPGLAPSRRSDRQQLYFPRFKLGARGRHSEASLRRRRKQLPAGQPGPTHGEPRPRTLRAPTAPQRLPRPQRNPRSRRSAPRGPQPGSRSAAAQLTSAPPRPAHRARASAGGTARGRGQLPTRPAPRSAREVLKGVQLWGWARRASVRGLRRDVWGLSASGV